MDYDDMALSKSVLCTVWNLPSIEIDEIVDTVRSKLLEFVITYMVIIRCTIL